MVFRIHRFGLVILFTSFDVGFVYREALAGQYPLDLDVVRLSIEALYGKSQLKGRVK